MEPEPLRLQGDLEDLQHRLDGRRDVLLEDEKGRPQRKQHHGEGQHGVQAEADRHHVELRQRAADQAEDERGQQRGQHHRHADADAQLKLCAISVSMAPSSASRNPAWAAVGGSVGTEHAGEVAAGRNGREGVQQAGHHHAMAADAGEDRRADQPQQPREQRHVAVDAGSNRSESVSPPARLIRSPAIWMPEKRMVIPSPRHAPTKQLAADEDQVAERACRGRRRGRPTGWA